MLRRKTRSHSPFRAFHHTVLVAAWLATGCGDDGDAADDADSGADSGADSEGAEASGTDSGGADESDTGTEDTGGPVELQLLDCPSPGALPFETMATDFETDAGRDAAMNPRIKDEASDLLGVPGGVFGYTNMPLTDDPSDGALLVSGKKARTAQDMGLASTPVPGEWVSLWAWDGAAWSQLDRAQTDDDGDYAFDGLDPTIDNLQPYYAVLEGDATCAAHYTFLLPDGAPVIVTDIDGTLTESDGELFMQVSDGDYDPLEKAAASQLTNAWSDKGYTIVYLTARPHVFRAETRQWLIDHDFPVGPLITANSLVLDDTAREYKATWVDRVRADFGWRVAAAYGNATSDIEAFADGGIPTEITFIIGENAGDLDTVPVEDNDYSAHIADFVEPHPDAADF